MSWRNLPRIVPLTAIEEVHLSLEAALLEHCIGFAVPSQLDDHSIAGMLMTMAYMVIMPSLSYVYTDLTTNTLHILKPELKNQLRDWLTSMQKRDVTVITYIKTSRYADHRYCSLEEVWDAEPHWEYWEPSPLLGDVWKWSLLGRAVERDHMSWRVTNYGSVCQWFEDAEAHDPGT